MLFCVKKGLILVGVLIVHTYNVFLLTKKLDLFLSWNIGKNQMSEAEEISVGYEGKRHKNGNGSSAPGDDNFSLLSDDIALLILARLPRSKYRDLRLVNRRFRSLIRSGELNKIRKKIGCKEPKVFLISNGDLSLCYEPYTRSSWCLPKCQTTADIAKNSFCVGTHLFTSVINLRSSSHSNIWRYDLELNRWFNGPMMITPRFIFASADCGSVACVAGGTHQVSRKVLNSAEKYNPETKSWEPLLASMNRQRKYCPGFYMDSKFYVIGGRNENGNFLTCGECYDFERNVWELIPNMIEIDKFPAFTYQRFTYFMVVVSNELYYFNSASCLLMVYSKNKNTWKKVGSAPASLKRNSALALMSAGNELLLIGKMWGNYYNPETVLCVCTPSPDLDDVKWHVLDFKYLTPTVKSCCVMMV